MPHILQNVKYGAFLYIQFCLQRLLKDFGEVNMSGLRRLVPGGLLLFPAATLLLRGEVLALFVDAEGLLGGIDTVAHDKGPLGDLQEAGGWGLTLMAWTVHRAPLVPAHTGLWLGVPAGGPEPRQVLDVH